MKRRVMVFGSFVLLAALVIGAISYGSWRSRPAEALLVSSPPGGVGPWDPGSLGDTSRSGAPGINKGTDGTGHEAFPSTSDGVAAAAPTSTTASAAPLLYRGTQGASAPVAPAAPGSGLNSGTTYQQPYQSDLTAGQVDDNAKFGDYLNYLRNYSGNGVIPIDVSQRLFVRVLDGSQQPVAGARVRLFDGDRQVFDGTTMSDGRALFFPSTADAKQATRFRAVISRGQTSVEATLKAGGPEQVVSLGGLKDNSGAVGIDLVFLLDSTGSMGDEIEKIKGTVGGIAQRIEQLPGSSAPRFGLVTFRDRGDEYVTRSWDFTPDIQQFAANLSTVQAGGGGDTPESVSAGLHDAIHLPGWADNGTGRHLRMIVLVGDAPPHIDYQDDYSYPELLQEAATAGIKIFPVGGSNIDGAGEYVFRQFAEATQGQFVFLTYANGVSGAPGLSTDMHVTNFTVQNLDTLIVKLVAGEVANQTGQKIDDLASQLAPAVVPAMQAVAPSDTISPAPNWLAATLDDFLASRGGAFWVALLLLVAAVVVATRKQVVARAAPAQSQEIYVPEGSIVADQPTAQTAGDGYEGYEERMAAAYLQAGAETVALYLDVHHVS